MFDMSLTELLKMVEQRWDKIGRRIVAAVLVVALLVFFVWGIGYLWTHAISPFAVMIRGANQAQPATSSAAGVNGNTTSLAAPPVQPPKIPAPAPSLAQPAPAATPNLFYNYGGGLDVDGLTVNGNPTFSILTQTGGGTSHFGDIEVNEIDIPKAHESSQYLTATDKDLKIASSNLSAQLRVLASKYPVERDAHWQEIANSLAQENAEFKGRLSETVKAVSLELLYRTKVEFPLKKEASETYEDWERRVNMFHGESAALDERFYRAEEVGYMADFLDFAAVHLSTN